MIDRNYEAALQQARENLVDVKKRGDDALSDEWEEIRKEIFTPAEIASSDLRVAIISELIKARRERGISQYQLEAMSGVKQSAIARLESGNINPTVETVQKLLTPLGKQLAVVSI